MNTIPWATTDPDTIERIIAVLLSREHTRARRIKPSQGDAGLDVLVPGASDIVVDNYQVKSFADHLNASRRQQIKKSLQRAIDTHNATELPYEIKNWYLTLPLDLTTQQETWLFELADELGAPFPVRIMGLTDIEGLLLQFPNVRDYYVGDGLERLETALARIMTLADLEKLVGQGVGTRIKPEDATDALAGLHRTLNEIDPHFNYDFEVTANPPPPIARPGLIASVSGRIGENTPTVTWHVYAKYDAALLDRPIPIGFAVDAERMSPELRSQWESWHRYGTPVDVDEDVVVDLTLGLPGGLGHDGKSAPRLRLGPADNDMETPSRSRWILRDGAGVQVAELVLEFSLVGRGIGGGEFRVGRDLEGLISVEFLSQQMADDTGEIRAKLSVDLPSWVGQPVQRVLPMLRFVTAWGEGHRLSFASEFGADESEEFIELHGDPPIPTWILQEVEALGRISSASGQPILLPKTFAVANEERRNRLCMIGDLLAGREVPIRLGELILQVDAAAYDELLAEPPGPRTVPWPLAYTINRIRHDLPTAVLELASVRLEAVGAELEVKEGMRPVNALAHESDEAVFRLATPPATAP